MKIKMQYFMILFLISVQTEVELPEPPTTGKPAVGIDLSLVRLATVSDSTEIPPVEGM